MSDESTRTHTMDVAHSAGTASHALRIRPATGASTRASAAEAHGEGETLRRNRVLVGRGEGADVRLDDPTVSQFHVELVAGADGVLVTDLGSRNGTRVGDIVVRSARVPFGTTLHLGAASLVVEDGGRMDLERSGASSFGDMVGTSPVMREVYALLERLARTDLAVLVEGDTGTGKELAARGLHASGPRAPKPFLVLDCTSIPTNLAESALFGHEKGAFTGANERRAGIFEAASGGTVFLDEIGELPRDLQPKLLRVLEAREVVPVGSNVARPVDVRIVSATWRDLRTLVNQGAFREDLYYRLAQARVRIPSLAERHDDLKPLVQHFLSKIPWRVKAARAIDAAALDAIASRSFPGNVRELKAAVERAAMLAEGATITLEDLAFERMLAVERARAEGRVGERSSSPPAATEAADPNAPLEPFKEAKRTLIDDFEKAYLARLLARAGTNISRAASLAGIERQSLRDLLKRHGLRGDD